MQTAAAPVSESERLDSLDVLRGFAVLGILVMNIQMFTMPTAAYFNPYALGEPATRDLAIWSISHVLADLKFMTIFSMLFGAGVLLMTTRTVERGGSPVRLHYRRMFWLLLFGLAHAYLLWHGDILVLYAVCGMLLYGAREFSARTLVTLGLVVLAVGSMFAIMAALSMNRWPPEAVAEFELSWSPSASELATETAAFQGGYLGQLPTRASFSLEYQTFDLVAWGLWRAGGLMLLGMALFKLGVLPGARPTRFYTKLAGVGFGLGLPVVAWGQYQHHATGWNMRDSFFLVSQWNYWGSIMVSLGWVGLLLALRGSSATTALFARLSAVGRMAFSCYIFETLVCTLVFYGHGLGLFGRVDRVQQMAFTAGVWVILLVLAPLWLRRFRYGPLEWLWRSLTYGRVEPMVRRTHAIAVG
jgi:uncharacterized protein